MSAQSTQPVSHGPLHTAWHRAGAIFGEMNYAARRMVEVQAPWVVDAQRRTR